LKHDISHNILFDFFSARERLYGNISSENCFKTTFNAEDSQAWILREIGAFQEEIIQ